MSIYIKQRPSINFHQKEYNQQKSFSFILIRRIHLYIFSNDLLIKCCRVISVLSQTPFGRKQVKALKVSLCFSPGLSSLFSRRSLRKWRVSILACLMKGLKEGFKMSINAYLREVTCRIQYFKNCHVKKKSK